jgi:hypothetical protein
VARDNTHGDLFIAGNRQPMGHPTACFGPYEQPRVNEEAALKAAFIESAAIASYFPRAHAALGEGALTTGGAGGVQMGTWGATPFTGKAITADVEIDPHLDARDGGLTFIMWYGGAAACGAQGGGRFVLLGYKLAFVPPNGALLLLDGRLVKHGTEYNTQALCELGELCLA